MDSLSGMGNKILSAVSRPWKKEEDFDNGNVTSKSPSEMLRFEKQTKILSLEDDHILQILEYVNYGDLIRCRLLNRRFNSLLVSSELFLTNTVLTIGVSQSTEPEILFPDTPTEFYNLKVQRLDYEIHVKAKRYNRLASQNLLFNPPAKYLRPLKHLEFNSCFITWDTIKRVIIDSPNLQHISIIRCTFCDPHKSQCPTGLGEFDEFRVGERMSNLRGIKISETENFQTISTLLDKLNGFSSRLLERVWISFDPSNPSAVYSQADINTFCELLKTLLEHNCGSLKSLHLDIKIQALLNVILQHVFGQMDTSWSEFQLKEFVLSPPGCTPTPATVDITEQGNIAAEILCGFFHTQNQLRKIAIPHIRRCGRQVGQEYRQKVLADINADVEFLCVPNQDYLTPGLLRRLSKLRKLFVGGSVADNGLPIALDSKILNFSLNDNSSNNNNIDDHTTDTFNLSSKKTLRNFPNLPALDKFKEMGWGSSIVNGHELTEIIKRLHYLTKFEVTSQFPVMQDEDLQCAIENMPWLKKITISACDFLTDFGVTGILRNTCEMMVRLENYHEMKTSNLVAPDNSGHCISNLKGLKSLVLMGKSNITDVGLAFGIQLAELSTVCLPYNDHITEWGLEQFGKNNPSMEIFICWALNKRSREGFEKVIATHPRVRKDKCAYLEYLDDSARSQQDDFPASIMRFDGLRSSVASALNGMCSSFNCSWLFGSQGLLVASASSSASNLAPNNSPSQGSRDRVSTQPL